MIHAYFQLVSDESTDIPQPVEYPTFGWNLTASQAAKFIFNQSPSDETHRFIVLVKGVDD